MSFGPNPWQQTQWDWRAAGNFICGGAGGGLIAFAVMAGTQGTASTWLLLGGIALVGTGLLCVWLELGRPLRAWHVFFNPRTSWMTREAFVATLLMPAALAAAAGWPGFTWLAAALALGYVYCQSRMLQAGKGIPAWREPSLVPLLLLTGLAEGAGLGLLALPAQAVGQPAALAIACVFVLGRAACWLEYRRRVSVLLAPRALAALADKGHRLQIAGFWLPIVALVPIAAGWVAGTFAATLAAAGGVAIVGAGAWFKFTLITRAGFNQGFTLTHLPVRGVRR